MHERLAVVPTAKRVVAPPPTVESAPAAPPSEILIADVNNPSRIIAFYCAAVVVFIRVGMLQQVLPYVTHVNLYYLYIFSVPALFGVLVTGGVRRTFYRKPAYYWMAFALWMLLCIPFSLWRGGSFPIVYDYFRSNIPILFLVAGLTLTWKECRKLIWLAAFGGVVNLVSARMFTAAETKYGYRMGTQIGSVANPNDFAGHMVFVLPFLLCIFFLSKSIVVRVGMLAAIVVSILQIVRTASRGAVIALAVMLLYYLVRASARQKIVVLAMVPILVAVALAVVPKESLQRIESFSGKSNAVSEAVASQETRTYLLGRSIVYSFQFPIFGIGPNMFSDYEVFHNEVGGMAHGTGLGVHNSYTEVSSECGLPAFFFFMAGIVTTYMLLNRTYRDAGTKPENNDIRMVAFCVMLSLLGYCVAIAFLNFAYFFYTPFFGGLAIAVARGAKEEMRLRSLPQPAGPTWGPKTMRTAGAPAYR